MKRSIAKAQKAAKARSKIRAASGKQNRPKTRPQRDEVAIFVGTRKGAFIYYSDSARRRWRMDGPHFLGHIINHVVLDPRDGRTLLAAARTGHLGPTVFRSTDMGKTWTEASRPPMFGKPPEGMAERAVGHTCSLTPALSSEPGVWFAGTSPAGIFRSEDGGATWSELEAFNRHPMLPKWAPPDNVTPDNETFGTVLIDPRDGSHMYYGSSAAGVLETGDRGANWRPLNRNVEANFAPDPFPEYGQDTHCLAMHPGNPDRLYQQNHCGIYRLDRPGEDWIRIGRNMPVEIGDIGFGIVLDPRNADRAWVFPMDGTEVWPRTSPDGKPSVYQTRDGGESWQRQDRGFPREHAYYTVLRQAFAGDGLNPFGLYFGTTSGEVWMSRNEGESWMPVAAHLQRILSVEVAVLR
ncbi:MAG TPA: hypothetical protein VJX23_15450 [Candidatus Binataceae bacterium]|nr:hypothetical protein [Candidatus Binataceae bacterium]